MLVCQLALQSLWLQIGLKVTKDRPVVNSSVELRASCTTFQVPVARVFVNLAVVPHFARPVQIKARPIPDFQEQLVSVEVCELEHNFSDDFSRFFTL